MADLKQFDFLQKNKIVSHLGDFVKQNVEHCARKLNFVIFSG